MNIHLKQYLEIYQKFPVDNYLSKDERKNRHKMLVDWGKLEIQEYPTLNELIEFITQNKDIVHINPQFFQKFQSIWKEDLKNGYQFAEFIIEMNLQEMMWKFDISHMELVSTVLKYNPYHIKALKLKLKTLIRYHDFNLHELPWGVLVEGSLEEELQSVKEMEEVADKLGYKYKDFEFLVSYCKTYYPLWFEYLSLKEKYGFKHFLESKEIDTKKISIPYIVFNDTI
ncbi:hypothetical protein [Gemelliphila palaticanis]|uniref:Uncharacterized protein n=1 Tax=Gemelliphila palaticanis TaxID=81950 RepID=A0ABX2T1S9_9BACL|nr:hypothetical protein [Gemella palaticanis]MBF0715677.1 hypothetical protein [Gemella palaticanis]NYS47607.1 hypothetical protein [Gemella palaticanis]